MNYHKPFPALFFTFFLFNILNSQEINFNNNGVCEVKIEAKNKSRVQLFREIEDFTLQYFGGIEGSKIDSLSYKISTKSSIYDIFLRGLYPGRKPILTEKFSLDYKFEDNYIFINIRHIKFVDNLNIDYYLELEELLSNDESSLLYKEDRQYFIQNFKSIISSINNYLNNKVIRISVGPDLDYELYYPFLLNFNHNGVAEAILKYPNIDQTRLYDACKNFIYNRYISPSLNLDIPNTIIMNSSWFDIFNSRYNPKNTEYYETKFELKIIVIKDSVKLVISHKNFKINGKDLLLKFEDFQKTNKFTETDKNYLIKNYSKILSNLKYYLDSTLIQK